MEFTKLTMTDPFDTVREALRKIDALDRAGHDSEVAADMGFIARAALGSESE